VKKPLAVQTLHQHLMKLFQASTPDELMERATQTLVQYFHWDFAAVYKQIGLGDFFTRRHFYSLETDWNYRTIPEELQLDAGFNFNQDQFIRVTEHPFSVFVKDPFTQGESMIGLLGTGSAQLIYAHCNGKRISDQEELTLFWMALKSKCLQSAEFGGLMNAIAEPGQSYTTTENEKKMKGLELANEELSQFAFRVSHDLQEPLRTVSNYIGLYYRNFGHSLSAEGAEYLGFAKDAAERMHHLVKDLLIYSRLDHKRDNKVRVDGTKLLEEALENIKISAEESDALILYEDLPEIFGYEKQLVSLFQNLLDNAIKFKGKQSPVIAIDCNRKPKSWEFRISDNGIGVQDAFHDKIFNAFTKLHAASEYKGTGLGLSICKKIVENHNGQIKVESVEGKGATFIFDIQR
jgi:signal transduction histidine kinase